MFKDRNISARLIELPLFSPVNEKDGDFDWLPCDRNTACAEVCKNQQMLCSAVHLLSEIDGINWMK